MCSSLECLHSRPRQPLSLSLSLPPVVRRCAADCLSSDAASASNSPSWLAKVFGLITFATLLAPAFAQVAWFYLTSPRGAPAPPSPPSSNPSPVKRNLVYGPLPRNTLDLYLPDAAEGAEAAPAPPPAGAGAPAGPARGAPVVIFVTGGMWIIGYKAWGSLLCSR